MARKKMAQKRWTKPAQIPAGVVLMANVYGSVTNQTLAEVIEKTGVEAILEKMLIKIGIDPKTIIAAANISEHES